MSDAAIDNQLLVRRTLVTVGVMVGVSVLFVGTVTLVAASAVAHSVGASSSETPTPTATFAAPAFGPSPTAPTVTPGAAGAPGLSKRDRHHLAPPEARTNKASGVNSPK